MDIDRARTFLEIIHTGSFLGAADRLHVTQTTVSARIRTLEDDLGRRLFVRNRTGAQLTPAGREFQRALHQVGSGRVVAGGEKHLGIVGSPIREHVAG